MTTLIASSTVLPFIRQTAVVGDVAARVEHPLADVAVRRGGFVIGRRRLGSILFRGYFYRLFGGLDLDLGLDLGLGVGGVAIAAPSDAVERRRRGRAGIVVRPGAGVGLGFGLVVRRGV